MHALSVQRVEWVCEMNDIIAIDGFLICFNKFFSPAFNILYFFFWIEVNRDEKVITAYNF